MAGYKGYSMSNNAVSAYEDGEKPLSKWTKTDIIDGLGNLSTDIKKRLNKLTASELKSNFLYKSSWHHTSKYYNKTDFYSIEDMSVKEIENVLDKLEKRTAKEPTRSTIQEELYRRLKNGKYSYKTPHFRGEFVVKRNANQITVTEFKKYFNATYTRVFNIQNNKAVFQSETETVAWRSAPRILKSNPKDKELIMKYELDHLIDS